MMTLALYLSMLWGGQRAIDLEYSLVVNPLSATSSERSGYNYTERVSIPSERRK